MEVRELSALRAVRAQGGVTGAAAVLHLTPSAVSQQLAALQRDVGVPLTRQVGRRLQLTPAGEVLADAAVDVAVALERARAACDAFLERPSGTVSVSAFQSGAELLLPGLLTRVRVLGGIELHCSEADVAQGDFAALTDSVDVVVAHRPEGDLGWERPGSSVRIVTLLREPLDVAVPLGHRLADRRRVRPADLVDEDWILVREGFPVAGVTDAVAVQAGRELRVVHRINDFHVVAALVAAGHGISLLPRYTAGAHPGVRLVPLDGVAAGRRVDALLRPDRAERLVVRRVLDELVGVAEEVAR